MAPLLLLLSTLLLSSLLYYFFFPKERTKGSRAPLPPGPTGWPVLGNLPQLGPKPHHTLHALSRAHGPLFRLRLGSVDVVVAASADVAAQFLRVHDANFSHRPPNSGAEHIAYNYQDLVFAPYGPRWRARRKILNLHLFSGKALEDLRPVREGELALLVRELRNRAGAKEPVDLGRAANKCATNALARATMGRRVFLEEDDEEAAEFEKMVVELMRLAGVFNVGDFVPGIGWLDLQGVVRRMKKLHRRYDEFLDGLMAAHRRAAEGGGGRGKDLLSVLLGVKEEDLDFDGEGGKLTDTDIKALLLVSIT